MFEIQDDTGTRYSGTEQEMREQLEEMVENPNECSWEGDLVLVKIVRVIKR